MTKPQLILIHGMWSRPWVWGCWRERFEQAGFCCSAVELPGHEEDASDDALKGLRLADYVAAVALETSRWKRPVLIGHSLGGLIAQIVASQTYLTAMVLVCSAAPGQIFPLRPIMLPGLARHFVDPMLWRRSFRLSRFESEHLLFNAMPKDRRAALHDRLIAESGRIAYQVGFGRLNLAGSNRASLSGVTCPVRALAGVRDHIIPIAVSRRVAALYPRDRIEFTEYDRHAHWMLEEPGSDERCGEIIKWLESIMTSPVPASC